MRAQAELKNRGQDFSQAPELSLASETDTVHLEDSTRTIDSEELDTMISCDGSTHREMSDKDDIYDTSIEEEVASPEPNASCISDVLPDYGSPDIIDDEEMRNALVELAPPDVLDESASPSPEMLSVTESITLLEETKELYNMLEQKANQLEQKYFSPDKMKCALSDPLGSFVLETPDTLVDEPDIGEPVCESGKKLERKASSVTQSIEYFEQLSSSSICSSDITSTSNSAEVPSALESKSAVLQKRRSSSQQSMSESEVFSPQEITIVCEENKQVDTLITPEITKPVSVDLTSPGAFPVSPPLLNSEPSTDPAAEEIYALTGMNPGALTGMNPSALTEVNLERIPVTRSSRRLQRENSFLSVETGTTASSRNTVSSTGSTAILRVRLQRDYHESLNYLAFVFMLLLYPYA